MRALNRPGRLAVVIVLAMCLTASVPIVKPPTAKAGIGSPVPSFACDLIPDGIARKICKAGTDPVGTTFNAIPGIPSASSIAGDVAGAIVQPILNQIASAEADAVASVLQNEVKFVNATTTPALSADWFTRQYAIVFGMSLFLGLGMFYLRIGAAAKDQEAGEMVSAGWAVLTFLIVGALLPALVGLAVKACDEVIAPGWMNVAGQSATDTLNNMRVNFRESISASNNPVTPILLPLIFLFFGLIGGVLVEFMLLFRDGMVYLVTAAEVVALAAWVGGRWGVNSAFRTTMTLLGLVIFKVIVAFILVMGLLLFGAHDGTSPVLLGAVILLMVPLLSWAAYRSVTGHTFRNVPNDYAMNQARALMVTVGAKVLSRS
jgi:hypothetical protein